MCIILLVLGIAHPLKCDQTAVINELLLRNWEGKDILPAYVLLNTHLANYFNYITVAKELGSTEPQGKRPLPPIKVSSEVRGSARSVSTQCPVWPLLLSKQTRNKISNVWAAQNASVCVYSSSSPLRFISKLEGTQLQISQLMLGWGGNPRRTLILLASRWPAFFAQSCL